MRKGAIINTNTFDKLAAHDFSVGAELPLDNDWAHFEPQKVRRLAYLIELNITAVSSLQRLMNDGEALLKRITEQRLVVELPPSFCF
ncbi:hypothetical protein [Alteromonas lipotrueae]|uniref:hypothetical protein n=1 Tax=Alteromonas lipotrueae TaxID=2803814 RepID=UPI001C658187|nr:hypothetical protein [Alteromonas lipotrueae]